MAERHKSSQGREEQLLFLLKNIPDFIVTVNRAGVIRFINNTLISRDVLGKSVYDYISKDNLIFLEKAIKTAFDKKEKCSFEMKVKINEARTEWYSVRTGPLILNN